jgi:cyclase
LRVVGDPAAKARAYHQQGADELHYQDIVASLYGRSTILDLVQATAEQVFVPLMVGGGIRTIQDIKSVLRAGADKVCINTAAVRRPQFITEACQTFGSQCIVVAVEALKRPDNRWHVFTNNGRQPTGLDARDWAMRAVELGAGELILTSVDKEGTKKGLDMGLIRQVIADVNVPVIVHGGVGSVEHIAEGARAGASAVALASLLHYGHETVGSLKSALNRMGLTVRNECE